MNGEAAIRAVVFDMDGLMFNTEQLYVQVGDELLRRRGKQITPELLDAMMGRPSRVALGVMIQWHALEATVEQLQEESDAIFPAILERHLEPMPGLMRLLDRLDQQRLPYAIATSSRRRFLERVLGQFELLPRFQFTLTAEDVRQGKPHPEIYLTAAQRLGRSPGQVMVLEDSAAGCSAAVAAGTFAVAVPGGHSRNHEFPGARFVADSLEDPRIYAAL